jgi:hypothetical protein
VAKENYWNVTVSWTEIWFSSTHPIMFYIKWGSFIVKF